MIGQLIQNYITILEEFCGYHAKDNQLELEKAEGEYVTIISRVCSSYMVESLKTKKSKSSIHYKDIYLLKNSQYNLKSKNHLQFLNLKTAKYIFEDIQYIGRHL